VRVDVEDIEEVGAVDDVGADETPGRSCALVLKPLIPV
jgi:hypothetical protein